jgi:hypothetical protein
MCLRGLRRCSAYGHLPAVPCAITARRRRHAPRTAWRRCGPSWPDAVAAVEADCWLRRSAAGSPGTRRHALPWPAARHSGGRAARACRTPLLPCRPGRLRRLGRRSGGRPAGGTAPTSHRAPSGESAAGGRRPDRTHRLVPLPGGRPAGLVVAAAEPPRRSGAPGVPAESRSSARRHALVGRACRAGRRCAGRLPASGLEGSLVEAGEEMQSRTARCRHLSTVWQFPVV